jgi:hypothetical protein
MEPNACRTSTSAEFTKCAEMEKLDAGHGDDSRAEIKIGRMARGIWLGAGWRCGERTGRCCEGDARAELGRPLVCGDFFSLLLARSLLLRVPLAGSPVVSTVRLAERPRRHAECGPLLGRSTTCHWGSCLAGGPPPRMQSRGLCGWSGSMGSPGKTQCVLGYQPTIKDAAQNDLGMSLVHGCGKTSVQWRGP